MAITSFDDVSWERMSRANERVRERLQRATNALDTAAIRYAVAGGNAVAAWVSRVEESAVRHTQDVDILLGRSDLHDARRVLEHAGFVYRHVGSIDMFLDSPEAKARDAVYVVFAGERVREHYAEAAPDVDEAEVTASFRLLSLGPLVRMKLTSFRDKDRVHLCDLAEVGLIDNEWIPRLRDPLASRLQSILDDTDG